MNFVYICTTKINPKTENTMKNYLIALLAIIGLGLASCGGGNKDKAAENQESQAVEQKAQEVQQEAQQQESTPAAAEENKTEGEQAAASGKSGKDLFLESGCVACHKETEKSVGPALKDIAAKYGDAAKLTTFLKGNAQAIVDPAQFSVMKPNLEITKKMNDADLKALVDYILSIK